ncbi:MAG: hypothetical protein AABY22_14795, partial [Nanoarchaeota archaeon]
GLCSTNLLQFTNSILINPCQKIPVYDNIFFKQGQQFNQGSFYDFDDQEFINGLDLAIERFQKDRINHTGIKLQEEFSSEKMVNRILEEIEK